MTPYINGTKLSAMSCYLDDDQELDYLQVANLSQTPKVIHQGQAIAFAHSLGEEDNVTHVGYMTKNGIEEMERRDASPPEELLYHKQEFKEMLPLGDFNMARTQRKKLERLLLKHRALFRKSLKGSRTDAFEARLLMKHGEGEVPIAAKERRRNPRELEYEYEKELLKQDLIESSKSEYRFPVVLVDKKDGKKRVVVDYRKLNEHMKKLEFPLPVVEDIDRKSVV